MHLLDELHIASCTGSHCCSVLFLFVRRDVVTTVAVVAVCSVTYAQISASRKLSCYSVLSFKVHFPIGKCLHEPFCNLGYVCLT